MRAVVVSLALVATSISLERSDAQAEDLQRLLNVTKPFKVCILKRELERVNLALLNGTMPPRKTEACLDEKRNFTAEISRSFQNLNQEDVGKVVKIEESGLSLQAAVDILILQRFLSTLD